jgi:hypothetical protein
MNMPGPVRSPGRGAWSPVESSEECEVASKGIPPTMGFSLPLPTVSRFPLELSRVYLLAESGGNSTNNNIFQQMFWDDLENFFMFRKTC